LQRVASRDLAREHALELVAGPLGEDRQDWRIAWLAFWVASAFGGMKDYTAEDFLQIFLADTRAKREHEQDVVEIIDEDMEASDRKARQLQEFFEARYPRKDKTKAED
jgi:hypothetical protein